MPSEVQDSVYGPLSVSLTQAKLGDLCVKDGVQTGPFGSQLHKDDYVATGTPIITVEHLGENRLTHQNLPRVSDADRERLSKYQMKSGDIVFSRVGSVDRRALVQPHENGWLFSGRCLRVRPNSALLDSTWLSYFFGFPAFKEYIRGIAVGATMPSINTKILSDVPIYYPSLDAQAEIGRTLKALDDKIALLRETNATLEAIAQALFKSWFVDFDPVRAKAEGRDPEGVPPEVADLFPSEFADSGLGEIPKGWRVGTLQDLLVLQRGFDLPAQARTPGKYPIIAASGPCGTHVEAMAKGPGVVTGRSGVLGKVFLELEDYWPLNTTLWVKEFKAATPCYAFEVLKRLDFQSYNAGSAVPTLNRNHIHGLAYLVPSQGCVQAFEEIASLLHQRVRENDKQADSLVVIRNTLLPRLMSGKLRLSDSTSISEVA